MMKCEVWSSFASSWLYIISVVTMMMMRCQAQNVCPVSSSNCSIANQNPQYVFNMKCSNFGVQPNLPDACADSRVVQDLTLEPGTTVIATIQARALDGLKVWRLVLSRLGIEAVNEMAFAWLSNDLQELSLDENQLTTLPERVFSPLSGLKFLQLQNNRLTTIGRYLLDGLDNLLVLDLSGNRIGDVDMEAWTPVPLLSTLQLYDNVIDGPLNSTRLSGLTRLQELRLDGNRLSEMTPDAFQLLPILRKLNLARNLIPALPDSVFSANTVLQEVDLSQNEIRGLGNDVFNETRRLTTLSLHSNLISTLPIYVFRHMNNLRTLHLQRNSISGVLSNSLSGLSGIRYLDLSHNRIGSLPQGIFDPLGLVKTMSLASNQIAVVERHPFKSAAGNIESLDLSNNRLVSVNADWFQTNSRLTSLHLEGNRLNKIHQEAFSSLSELRELHLSRNLLSDIDGGLFRSCSSLNYVDLSSNPLRHVHHNGSTFTGLTSLRRMNLSTTCLTELSFGHDPFGPVLPNLEELDVSANTLTNLSASTFTGVPRLRQLSLSANDLDQLDNHTFSTLSKLQRLDLSANTLRSDDRLTAVLSNLPPLTVVDLSWNLLTSVDVLPPLPAGVYLAGNPLRCDCNLSSWLTANNFIRLRDSQRTACLDTETGLAAVLSCHWATCFKNVTTPPTGSLEVENGCAAPEDALSYLRVPRRRPAVRCPWDDKPSAVRDVSVDVTSTTSVRIAWNLTSATDVTVSVVSGVEPLNATGELYEFSANVSDCSVGNLTSGETYRICVTTSGGDRACAVVVLPVERTTTASPARLQIRMSATSTASALRVTWDVVTSGPVEVLNFRLTWTENGTSKDDDVSTAWTGSSNRSYAISGLRPATTYVVCVQAIGNVVNRTRCDHFSTQAATDDTLLIIIIASAAGGFLLLLLILIIIICCCCCCRRRHGDARDAPSKLQVTVRPVESTRSVNRGSLAEHSVVSVTVYEDLPSPT